VAGIFAGLKFGAILFAIRYYPTLEKALLKCIPPSVNKKRLEHNSFSSDRVNKRLKKESAKPDIWNLILKRDESSGLSLEEMHSNASIFMLAGTETTATLLSGLTYYLLKNPDKMKTLTEEIRGSFPSDADLTLEKLAQLKYMHACLEEGLRMYPPVPSGMSRLIPPGGAEICGEYVPHGSTVYATQLCMYRNPKNFRDPYEFVPERWISEEYASDIKHSLQPFSFGPRNCLGKK
jgi:cytochrome P450